MLKRFVSALAVAGLMLATLGTGSASAATTGLHYDTFTCQYPGGAEYGYLDVEYRVGRLEDGTWWLQFNSATWDTSPNRNLNALNFRLENSPGNYITISPNWGGSSSTHDDVASGFTQDRDHTSSWPTGTTGDYKWWFVNTSTPNLKLNCWGMGPGNTPSDAAHDDSNTQPIE